MEILGTLSSWNVVKTISFVSCGDPGTLVIAGKGNQGKCNADGMILHCTANETTTPWHNFVSNATYWQDGDGLAPCERNTGGYLDSGRPFLDDMLAAGAFSIWQDRKEVTLIGTPGVPRNPQVTCSFTIDDKVSSATFNEVELEIDGNLNAWNFVKTVMFGASNEEPGTLVISGRDNQKAGNCNSGGLILHCVAEDESSPWHDFVSENSNFWIDDNNEPPCERDSGGYLDGNRQFISDMLAKGAKSIWANRPEVSLTGEFFYRSLSVN